MQFNRHYPDENEVMFLYSERHICDADVTNSDSKVSREFSFGFSWELPDDTIW